jgi:hypothetical protein
MEAPVRDAFEIPYHDLGPPDAPLAAALVAGLHGDELNGVFVLSRLAGFLGEVASGVRPPAKLGGRIVIVPAVNVLGVNLRRRAWPFDGTDINRMFPGYGAGETTQRIADAVLETTRGARIKVDVHSSNADFEEVPQVRLVDPSAAEVAGAQRFGLPAVIEQRPSSLMTATLAHAWRGLGGETYVLQAGLAGGVQLGHCERLFRGLVEFLGHAGILDGVTLGPADQEPQHFAPDQTLPLIAARAGLFVSSLGVGAWVHAGQTLGYLYDAFDGRLLAEVTAPAPGLLSGIRRQPLLFEGDLLARIQTRARHPAGADTFLAGQGQ